MREILFRGKRIDNGAWIEGDLVYSVYKFVDYCVGKFGCALGMHQVDPSTVGQFTGRSDKNGKKIFEGDILNFDGTVYICYWNNGNLEFGLRNNEESVGMAYMAVYDAEIIGNIHDNPELLEV